MRDIGNLEINRRKLLQLAGAAAAVSLASPLVLRKTARASDQQITVLNTFPTLANEYWQGWNAGAKRAAEQLGIKYMSQTFDDSVDK